MNNYISDHLLDKRQADCLTRSQAQEFLALGNFMGWPMRIIGQAPMLEEPVRLKNWLLVPAQQDSTRVPRRTLRRIQLLFAQGLRPQGFVVVHEAPMQLAAPAPVLPERKPLEWQQVGNMTTTIAKGLGLLMLGSLLLPLGLLVVLDPILIAVTQDNDWIEIDRWQV